MQMSFDRTTGAWLVPSRGCRLCTAVAIDCLAGTGPGYGTGNGPGLGSAAVGPAERKCRSSGPNGFRERSPCRPKPSRHRVLSGFRRGNLYLHGRAVRGVAHRSGRHGLPRRRNAELSSGPASWQFGYPEATWSDKPNTFGVLTMSPELARDYIATMTYLGQS